MIMAAIFAVADQLDFEFSIGGTRLLTFSCDTGLSYIVSLSLFVESGNFEKDMGFIVLYFSFACWTPVLRPTPKSFELAPEATTTD